MKYWSKITICSFILLLVQSQAGHAVGPVDADDGSFSCELDGICRVNECQNDPDCSGDLPDPPDDTDTPAVEVVLTGQPFSTGVSGVSGSRYTRGSATSTDKAVFALLSRERSNHPCYVAVGTEDVNDPGLDTTPVPEIDLCGSSGPTSSTLHADYLDTNAGGSDDRLFVSGVQVCMNSGNDRVKGIRVAGKRITSTGTLVASGEEPADDRANCHQWESWVNCPAGQIATAVDLHFESGGTPRSLTGIALQCRTVAE